MITVVGLSGTNGAGKDSVADMLAERHNFFVVSATDMLADGLREKGWPIDREHKSKLSAEWRRQYGMAAIVDKGWEAYQKVKDQYQGFVIGSLRHPGEAERIQELGGKMVWVDADPKIRYQRITGGPARANKGSEDTVTFEEFLVQQEREMRPVGDEATLNMAGVKEKSDIFLANNGNDLEVFKDEVEAALGLVA